MRFKFTFTLLLTILLFFALSSSSLLAQDAGTLNFEKTLERGKSYDGNIYIAINETTFAQLRQQLKSSGVQVKGKYSDGSVILLLPNGTKNSLINQMDAVAYLPAASVKVSDELSYAGNTGVAITFFDALTKEALQNLKNDFGIIDNDFSSPSTQVLIGNMDASLIEALANMPEVAYISALVEEPEPLNDKGISFHQLGAATNSTGLDLQGEGMIVGLGDGGELGTHIDLQGRIINFANGTYAAYGDHADMMAGIIAGAGNMIDFNRGYAPKAQLITQKTFSIFYYMDEYYTAHGMRLTNNSYGSSFFCTTAGAYDYYSNMMDEQLVKYDDALHIVAVGNSGENTCDGYPLGYHTVLKTYSAAKNVLTVGAVMQDGSLSPISGQGPVADGRIKPEITALSEGINTTGGNNNYTSISGTSSATANVTGATTLVYERYKQLNNNENPKGALIKAIMCNTATDAGNPGPDFQYGFGIMNAGKAIENIEEGNFFLGETTSEGETTSYTITVPGNQKETKVLLTWNDIPQSIYDGNALINDLDLIVTAPDGTVYQPWKLDHTAANVTNAATRDTDRINNIEQVTISTPIAGTYTIKISTYNLESAIQKYAISYLNQEKYIQITYPLAGQTVAKNKPLLISWDSHLENVTSYEIEYSLDNGATWEMIGNAAADARSYLWTVVNAHTLDAKIKVIAQGNGTVVTTDRFNIFRSPSGLTIAPLCGSGFNLTWNSVGNVGVGYEVFMLQNGRMTFVGTTTETNYNLEYKNNGNETYWFTVRAIYDNEQRGLLATAKSTLGTDVYPCPWENDIEITGLSAESIRGRELTSNSLSNNEQITISVFNAGTNTVMDLPLTININGEEVSEIIYASLAPGASHVYVLSNTFDFSTAGIYDIFARVNLNMDTHNELDGKIVECTQLRNTLVDLPAHDLIEDKPFFTIEENTFGINEFPAMDFYTNNNAGLIKVIGSGENYGKILKATNALDTDNSEIIITKNLNNDETVFLKMGYKITVPSSANEALQGTETSNVELSVRGSDTESWIKVANLQAYGEWIPEAQVFNLSDVLGNQGQLFSSSTQLRLLMEGDVNMEVDEMSFLDQSSFLPVELLYFDAKKVEDDALLEWATASELNNEYFEIEVAKGDDDYREGKFVTLTRIEGQGTTSEETYYYFNDTQKFKTGVRYYRLKQVDFDGAYTYTKINAVYFDATPQFDLRIYPNPIFADINPNIYFELDIDTDVRFALSDASGKILMEINETFVAGAVNFPLDLGDNLAVGIYYLSTTLDENRKVISRILKIEQ
jgi:hypothetical protein